MSLKQSNEITIKIKCQLSKFYKIIEEKEFKIINKFSNDDTYFIPEETDIEKLSTRDILSKAVLVRDIIGKTSNKRTKLITFKNKTIDAKGNILNQESINCNILEIEDAKKLLKAIGYKEIMNIKEDDIVYEKDGFEIAIKDIKNGDNLIETEETKELDSIEKLIQKVNEIGIPIYTDNYFVKKAEKATEEDKYIAQDLLDTLKANKDRCVGLAANMIGYNKAIICISGGIYDFIMINPIITNKKEEYQTEEGCLALIVERKCKRYKEIEVECLDINFNKQHAKYSGFTAEIIQHEIDHTNGIIIY